ncbi:hypothetical protein ACFXPY_48770 [Streptomyces sp. NPDC059153]|uniref:hypothetical protein n=1 Tax=unclassified Streptomyces TaxID=2593676 RepID=UPI003673A289
MPKWLPFTLPKTAGDPAIVGRTVVLITHRLGSTRAADRIIVLDGGQLLEEGTHEALLEQGGEYAAMWRVQARTYSDQPQP